MRRLAEWSSRKMFQFVHGRFLIYNTCWEDPRLDRVAMNLGPEDRVLMITSAGCNALDYLLDEPAEIHAVDMNFRQNALLELKIEGIRRLEFPDFFQLFGRGRHSRFEWLYNSTLRKGLSPASRRYWDKHRHFFAKRGPSFYSYGTSGRFARLFVKYLRAQGILGPIRDLFEIEDLQEQAATFRREVKPRLWKGWLRWCLDRDVVHGMLGVPKPQRRHLEQSYPNGIVEFMQSSVESVFTEIPLRDNYFWRVYVFGEYAPECCPSYLTEQGFHRLKNGLIDRIRTHTGTLVDFLEHHDVQITRFVLLDHMDWLWDAHPEILRWEWQRIIERSAPRARYLWRSAGLESDFVDRLQITTDRDWIELGEILSYRRELAAECHAKDRVRTYGSFHVAELAA